MVLPQGAPPVSDWTPEELEDIEILVESGESLDRAREIVKRRRKPPGERERITPTQEKKGQLLRVLQAQGITLEKPDLDDFYDVLTLKVPPSMTWQEYLALPGEVGEVYAPWHAKREAERAEKAVARAEAERLSRQQRIEVERRKIEEKRLKLATADLKDRFADLKRRYPNNKNVLSELEDDVLAAWEEANARQQEEWDSLPPELQDQLGGRRPEEIPMDTFVRGLDLGRFAEEQGLGDRWQQGLFDDAFDRNVAEPLRQGAKTAAEKLAVEDRIAQLEEAASPALKAQFRQATEEQPGLTFDDFLASDTAKGILGEATRQSQTRIEPGGELAGRRRRQQEAAEVYNRTLRGESLTEIAADLNITENDARQLSQAGAAARQFFTGQATARLPGAGTTVLPEGGAGVVSTFTPVLGARNAALEFLSPEWRAKQREADIRAANQFNLEAQRQAREGLAGTRKAEAQRLFGLVHGVTDPTGSIVTRPAPNLDALNPQEVERYIGQLQGQLAKKQEREATLAAFKPVLDDTGFAPELDRFVAENRKITYAGSEFAPEDVYESREDVLARSAPRVASLYGAYQARKRQQPAARRIPRVL